MADIADVLLALGLLAVVLGSIALAMWIIFRIGMWIAFNMYGQRLGISEGQPSEDH